MLVVIEGPSAVGKTTLLQAIPVPQVVGEGVVTALPDMSAFDLERYFIAFNVQRWADLLHAEAQFGHAFADTDPLKLYYNLAQASIGKLADELVVENWRLARRAMEQHRLGFADHVVFLTARPATLQERKVGDVNRRRGGFALHLRLAPAWATYYAALEEVRPGTVQWIDTDTDGRPDLVSLASTLPPLVYDRYDLGAFDQLQTTLGVPR